MDQESTIWRRIAFRVMYDGTGFQGWQRQSTGRTVQEELEKRLAKLSGNQPVTVTGAGRTDSGVHAHGQVAHADVCSRYDDGDLHHALSRMCPDDLVVRDLRTVSDDFHARYSARRRSYRYRILLRPDPFRVRYGWYAPTRLDPELLSDAAHLLLGTHDFTALSKHNPDTPNSVCTIYDARWEEGEGSLDFHVTADRFLYGMVRLLVGVQYDVGRKVRPAGHIPELINSRDRAGQSMAVPAQGLSLVHVGYEDQIFGENSFPGLF